MSKYHGVMGPGRLEEEAKKRALAAMADDESQDTTPAYVKDGSERRTQKSNKVYEHIKKEIDIRAKRGGGPVKPAFQALSSKTKSNDLLLDTISKGLFVDANRNAAVSAGDRDLKSDVRDKKLREKKIGDAEDDTEVDFMIYESSSI